MVSRIDFSFGASDPDRRPRRRATGEPRRILVIADFSGGSGETNAPIPVTADDIDAAIRLISPKISLKMGEIDPISIELHEFDDLHPDRLARQLPECNRLLDLRSRLSDPANYAAAAAEITVSADASAVSGDDSGDAGGPDSTDFEELLGGSATRPNVRGADSGHRQRATAIIRDIVTAHLELGPDDRQPALIATVDEALTRLLRDTLQDPAFRRVETAWRGVHWLATGVFEEDAVAISIVDTRFDDGEALQRVSERLNNDAGVPGGPCWSLIVADFQASDDSHSISVLDELGRLGATMNAPIIAGAGSPLFESTEWNALRASPFAGFIGLAAPRFLLRQPYGKESDEIDSFNFEELPPRPAHEAFTWCNSAYLCARLISDAFQQSDDLAAALSLDCDDLPLVIYNDGSGRSIKPVAEHLMSESEGAQLLQFGIIPVMSYRDRNCARVMQLRSLAASGQLSGLAG